ncbi:hypothetical protein HBI56_206400 [Parastagonospora nodorum]|uniref:Uncharacterized protein n=2 Tax=Phaeosphaeria nodorum (strain SN15 / ATCC MYA-4574 / FGSC 10173) TaxID=321614 RepID=A0A7U2I8W7_PHANO|nr:hypothetical protein SNOG_15531 [Parastagonospora nodorum SN15]KAH3905501.1 hypothetical protein HBH56_218580 [Parastagonospora nodorum]EAT77196.1 hypothetical protein SNOG_15531 [Parastagonospora nodorum SN15]KAH3922824.1 hypothetical protein HBH54_220440 [Parastagonospora nodorum]KAH3941177.1 hypothetical protein HBH53_205210 [Parastagonospora nodorum]KAH3961492.1 hypothetical protein HBH52_231310 [Parastagonospora nodorum]
MANAAGAMVTRMTMSQGAFVYPKDARARITLSFPSRQMSGGGPRSTPRNIQAINWDNFDRGAWPDNTEDMPTYEALMPTKRRKEASLHKAQQDLARNPGHQLGTFWVTYHRIQLDAHRDDEKLHAIVAETDALACVLSTAPLAMRQRFAKYIAASKHFHGFILARGKTLRQCRLTLGLFKHLPFYAETHARAQRDSRYVAPQKNSAKGIAQEAEPSVKHADRHNAYPELWAIEPLSSTIKIIITDIKRQLLWCGWLKKYNGHMTSEKKLDELNSHARSVLHVYRGLLQLQRELKVLQYYSMQQYPGRMLGRRVDMGKNMWNDLAAETKRRQSLGPGPN